MPAPLTKKIDFSNWTTIGEGAIPYSCLWMVMELFVCVFLVWYLEQVLNVGYGVVKHPLFLFQKSYWQGSGNVVTTSTGGKDKKGEAEDLAAERARVYADNAKSGSPLIRLQDLRKDFMRAGKPFKAVDDVTFGINEKECFGLLGHNGAGKTTTINMLVGLFGPTAGDAKIGDYSIASDMDYIYPMMGICSQHNVLWDTLTGAEHLRFYGRLKNLSGKTLERAVQAGLKSVDLVAFGNQMSKTYSGGMKRRLSVACSLIGSPQITYMDEPSTGLDPASRHNLWDVISASKGEKSVVLTTHSMEEADMLCDRIGIMSHGVLQCLGDSASLKQRYGAGYTMIISSSDKSQASMDKILAFVQETMSSATLLNEPIGMLCPTACVCVLFCCLAYTSAMHK